MTTACRGAYPTTTPHPGSPTDLRVGDRVRVEDGESTYDGHVSVLLGTTQVCRMIRVRITDHFAVDVPWPLPFDVTITRIT
jgi:hypothetical protein